VARPALSASRTAAVLDLLTVFPERAFKISEIVEATKINIASCHALLAALTAAGYLTRTAKRTYMLGPAVVTAGQAARRANPVIDRAEQAAEQLFRELKITVYLTTIVGDEILMLRSISEQGPNFVGTRDGQRHPYIAPLGAHLVAWSPESVIDSWIAKAGVTDEDLAQEWRRSIALVRERGYQITLREPEDSSFVEMMAAMAKGAQALRYKDHAKSYLSTHHPHFRQPETLVPDAFYDVNVLAAPIFSHDRGTHLSLCLAGFPSKLSGAQITTYADHLLRTCLRVMQDNAIF